MLQTSGVGIDLAAHHGPQALGPVHEAVGVAVELVAGTGGHPPLMGGEGLVCLADLVPGHLRDQRSGRLDAAPVVERHASQLLAALGWGDERTIGHFISHGLIPGVADAGPDRDVRVGDGPCHRLLVEGGQISLGAAAPHDHDDIDRCCLEIGHGGGHHGGSILALDRRWGHRHFEGET